MRFITFYKNFLILILIAIINFSCSLFTREEIKLTYCGGDRTPIIPETKLEVLSFLPWDLKESISSPEIVGGIDSLINSIRYPELAKRAGVSGAILCEFVITIEGKAQNLKLIKGIGAGCDEALLDATKYLKYIPAQKSGKNIDQLMRVSVKFILINKKP